MRPTLVATLAIAWASPFAGLAVAQPIQWQHTIPGADPRFFLVYTAASAALARDGSGNVYAGRLGSAYASSVGRIDAAGILDWTAQVVGLMECLTTCGIGLVGFAADAAPGIALSGSPNPAPPGRSVMLVASLSGVTAPSGTVSFHDGSALLCAAIGRCAQSWTRDALRSADA